LVRDNRTSARIRLVRHPTLERFLAASREALSKDRDASFRKLAIRSCSRSMAIAGQDQSEKVRHTGE
jgi:hypothetical protein